MMPDQILRKRALGATQLYATIAYLLVYFVFWTAIDTAFHQEPPIDNVEQLNWALHPALGYAKHPPFPTWILWTAEQFFPAGMLLTYLLGAAEVLLTLALAFALGRATLGTHRAWLGALMVTCISYHTLRMHFFNHNTALLCANAAAMLCAWHAGNTPRLRWWALLGVSWAAGMLSKYQMALPIACNLAYLLWSRGPTRRLLIGLAVASSVSAILLAPHILWLIQNHFPTFSYASEHLSTSLPPVRRVDTLLRFFSNQLLRVLPVIALAALLHRMGRRGSGGGEPAEPEAPASPAALRFWAIHAFGPLILMSLMALLGGVDLEMHWGTAFLWALPLWFLSTDSGRVLARVPPPRAMIAIGTTQLLLIGGKILLPHI
jgi:4-amino-4-deoxy-L-arabinose transferase-like glycosyltransferase